MCVCGPLYVGLYVCGVLYLSGASFFTGKYVVLASLCVAAVLRPSVQGAFYFLVFLSSATWWACYKELRRIFAIVLRCVMVVVVLHIFSLYAYQFDWIQSVLDRNSTYARYGSVARAFL